MHTFDKWIRFIQHVGRESAYFASGWMGVVISGGFAGGTELADGMVHRAGDDGPMPSFLHGVQGGFDDFDLGWHWHPVAGQSEWRRALRFFPDIKRRIERVFDKINAGGGGVIELPQEFAKTFWRETGVKVEAQLGSGEIFQGRFRRSGDSGGW